MPTLSLADPARRWKLVSITLAGLLLLVLTMGQAISPEMASHSRERFHLAASVETNDGFVVLVRNDGQIVIVGNNGIRRQQRAED